MRETEVVVANAERVHDHGEAPFYETRFVGDDDSAFVFGDGGDPDASSCSADSHDGGSLRPGSHHRQPSTAARTPLAEYKARHPFLFCVCFFGCPFPNRTRASAISGY